MYVVPWTYRIAPGNEAALDALYGAHGGWARLLQRDPAYSGTELLRGTADASHYLTIDRWRTLVHHDAFLQGAREEYAALDRQGDAPALEETRLAAIDN